MRFLSIMHLHRTGIQTHQRANQSLYHHHYYHRQPDRVKVVLATETNQRRFLITTTGIGH